MPHFPPTNSIPESAFVPRVDDIDIQTGKIPDVAGRYRQLAAPGRARDQRIAQFQFALTAACLGAKPGGPNGGPGIEEFAKLVGGSAGRRGNNTPPLRSYGASGSPSI